MLDKITLQHVLRELLSTSWESQNILHHQGMHQPLCQLQGNDAHQLAGEWRRLNYD